MPRAAASVSLRLKELAQLTGRTEFLSENAFPATPGEARQLVAETCHHLNADDACDRVAEQPVWWFALHDIEHVRLLDGLTERVAETAGEVLLQETAS